MVFPIVMYGCESWTIRKAEHQRTDASELWCWRRLLRVPWTARGLNHSTLKEINPEYLLEGLMLKLKLQYTGYLMRRADALEKTLMLGKTENKRRERQKTRQHHRLNGREVTQIPGNGGGRRGLACGSPLGGKESTRHSNRTTLSPPTDGLEFLFLLQNCNPSFK